MKSLRFASIMLLTGAILAACGGGGGSSPTATSHEQAVSVNLGPNKDYVNGIFTSVKVCMPGTTSCQTIDDVLVDTGSYGLRLLGSATTLALPVQTDASNNQIGECIVFADGYTWGPVVTADVHLADEVASKTPVQIVGQSGFASPPSACSSGAGQEEDSLSTLGANGILGVGLGDQDCGSFCVTDSSADIYFACNTASSCVPTTESLADQVQNPVALLPVDNNGVQLRLPSIGATGASTVSGSLIFGIGTQSDNGLGSAQVLTTDDYGNIGTEYDNTLYSQSFIDSGSNALFFASSLPLCTGTISVFYCPTSTQSLSAQMISNNAIKITVLFSVANTNTLDATGNAAYNDLAGTTGSTLSGSFDWGMPFFYGRSVYFAIENRSTPGGTGPFFAF